MIYELAFVESALKEWRKLAPPVPKVVLVTVIAVGKRDKSGVYAHARRRANR
ncbi:MAG TPA: hypothetical protein VFS99_01720 [Xanthomonadaceae bacterium]|nr:hypothetical protein [Xanthomonadaceae bacterium]